MTEQKKEKIFCYHYKAGNNERGFTLVGRIDGENLVFGVAFKHPTGDKNYVKKEGRRIALARSIDSPYLVIKFGNNHQSPGNIFYREAKEMEKQFEIMMNTIETQRRVLEDLQETFTMYEKGLIKNFTKVYTGVYRIIQ